MALLPGNGIFVVRGEMSTLMTAMRRGARWSSHSHQDDDDPLLRNFQELKEILNKNDDLRLVQPSIYLAPFLEVIRSEETTGPVTSLALSAVNKFLAYGLIDPTHNNVPMTVHNIADAVTHARFVGTDQSSDGVVLMRILQVLRTLTLAPEGATLTNESLCEIMLSCFRICFETRLNELLRRTAEHYLKDMVQLVFMRLPQFSEDLRAVKQFKMRPGAIEQTRTKRKKSFRLSKSIEDSHTPPSTLKPPNPRTTSHLSTTPMTPVGNIVDMQGSISQNTPVVNDGGSTETSPTSFGDENPQVQVEAATPEDHGEVCEKPSDVVADDEENQDYVNQRGIRFTQQIQEEVILIPYGLACVRELFRFLISLCNPLDKQNSDVMIHLGLTLLTVAFEVGADSIGKYSPLLALVKDDLCRNLFLLLASERLSVFAIDLQVCFLMFESLRTHLKFQLEFYLTKLIDIIVTDSGKISYEHKEIALDNILQLWRIPGLVTELYLNYDCNMYCTNLYEDLTKLLAKNAFSATAGVYHTHMLSLDALLTVVESIERHCSEDKGDSVKIEDNVDHNESVESINSFIGANMRQKISEFIPSKEELLQCKNIKKWLPTGTEHFNHKAKKGIQFLQEHGVLKGDLDANEIALFLRENSALDKKMIGEYLGNRSNVAILDAFLKTFDFTNMRIDEALRHYLESFRLPGEAPIISHLMEHFAEHWHKSNGEPFVDVDAAFTLAYAVIILNVDQHNQNAKKQTTPMSLSGFKKNLKGVNGGNDFDEAMLEEIYNAIKHDEIVMPAEQTGLVRENYLWKVLLRKGCSKDGHYYHVTSGQFDSELFALIWGPIVAALSFVFDKSEEQQIYKKALSGFETCASISSHFQMSKNLDMLVVTLAKFTMFHNNLPRQHQLNGTVAFGSNVKARLALKAMVDLCHQHGDNIREGWRNFFDVVLSLYQLNLLPKLFTEAEDFIEASGRVVLVYEEVEHLQKQDTSLFSSLYSYMVSSENLSKVPTFEEQQHIDAAKETIKDCNLDQIITDSKFLHDDALMELVKALIELSRGPDVQKSLGYNYNENIAVFFLELLIKIVIQNRDRVMTIWQSVRDHIYTLVMNASVFDYQFLLERSVIGLLRIAIRLMRNEEMSPIVLQSLRMLLLLKSSTLCRISRQISFGLYELLKTSAQNIHTKTDWTIVFTLLECVGAGAQPPKPIVDDNQTKSDGEGGNPASDEETTTERGYTSDSELTKSPKNRHQSPPESPNTGGWILVGNEGEIQPVVGRTVHPSQYSLALERNLGQHDPQSLIKCCESLAFLVRDVAHITPYNFDDCVHCIRTFVEASLHGTKRHVKRNQRHAARRLRKRHGGTNESNYKSPASSPDDSDEEDLPSGYHQIPLQLLDLMHTLHTRTAQIFKWWAEEGGALAEETSLWTQGWCPLLQGIARLCCDIRRTVRMSAITYLQRALLVHDLQTLTGPEWEACFHRVLFPLLAHLLNPIDPKDPIAMEETRMRAATVLSKVFLHHLTPLLSLATFSNLWLIILDFIDKYMHADRSDLLYEAIPESLKNMLLVMDSAKVFDEGPDGNKGALWAGTWERIHKFLPGMKEELFREMSQQDRRVVQEEAALDNLQHNVENATRSIILQPPQQQVSSHLFAHLGQMVSTPIANTPPPPPPFFQPTLQTGMPYLYAKNQPHTFPVLYSSPVITTSAPTEVQPVSLYAEYVGNPYNVDLNENNDDEANETNGNNVFQSANYFKMEAGVERDFIPPGSEILFGNEQSNVTIPVCVNDDVVVNNKSSNV